MKILSVSSANELFDHSKYVTNLKYVKTYISKTSTLSFIYFLMKWVNGKYVIIFMLIFTYFEVTNNNVPWSAKKYINNLIGNKINLLRKFKLSLTKIFIPEYNYLIINVNYWILQNIIHIRKLSKCGNELS